MHLVFLIDNPPVIGGGDYALYKYAEALARRGHAVDVFGRVYNEFMDSLGTRDSFRVRLRGEFPPVMRGVGRINRVWDRVHTRWVVESWLSRNRGRIDALVGYHRDSAIKATALGTRHGIPVINVVFESPEWIRRTLGAAYERQYSGRLRAHWEEVRAAYRASDLLLPLSECVRREVAAWTERAVEPPLYCGIDTAAVPPITDRSPEAPIVYIGRLDSTKNVNELIEATARLSRPPPLVIAGSGADEAELRELARQRGVSCQFRGRITDREKWDLLRSARFMVFPTSFEGFGIPPAEMLACGRPCICSDIPILREVYGDYVDYVPEHDLAALSAAMQRMIEDEPYARRRGEAGRRFVLETYTWDRSAERFERALAGLGQKERGLA